MLIWCKTQAFIFRESFILYGEAFSYLEKFFSDPEKFIIFRENCIFKELYIQRKFLYHRNCVYQINVFIFRENVYIQTELAFRENLKFKLKSSKVSLSLFDFHKENCSNNDQGLVDLTPQWLHQIRDLLKDIFFVGLSRMAEEL